eukprot:TRINITY_DN7691_c0_g1_i1.p1 TRINITY_DN7691_c0_g1~~TRINITY_DN7691_c0_g1_i1.p1  ORF type:complete len:330 (+),score=63.80 TRINITY_DN7691_c0_g1_i1:356-1345(+)
MGGRNSKQGKDTRATGIDYRATPTLGALGEAESANEITTTKELLEFTFPEPFIDIEILQTLDVVNVTDRSMKWNFEPPGMKDCAFVFRPAGGTLKKGKMKSVRVSCKLTQPENINFKLKLRTDSAETHFIAVQIHCDLGVFGSDPAELEQVEDLGCQVPELLAKCRKLLMEHDAVNVEGIFRLAGDAREMNAIKAKMNNKSWDGKFQDINTLSSLVKIWYRELPKPILNVVPVEAIFNAGEMHVCVEAYQNMPEPQKSLLDWLCEFLMAFADNSDVNKMTAQNLAIVVAPNLFDPPSSDPMEGLVLSQKCVQFLHNVLLHKRGIVSPRE